MTPAAPSPADVGVPARRRSRGRRPDARLLLGVLLILVSTVVGARLLEDAAATEQVWRVAQPTAAGTILSAEDLQAVDVSLGAAHEAYVPVTTDLVGRTVNRGLAPGELIPRSSVTDAPPARLVSVPVSASHAPTNLLKGQRVDVFVTYSSPPSPPRTELVLSDVPVQDVHSGGGGLSSTVSLSVVVAVPPADAAQVVEAVQSGEIDIIRVLGAV